MATLIRIKPYHYIHVLDQNTNVTRVVTGPSSFTKQDHEVVVFGPEPMIIIPPRHFCIIQNPACRSEDGKVIHEAGGQVKLKYGDEEIRFDDNELFPLYPGEVLYGKVSPLQVVSAGQALHLRAIRDFTEGSGKNKVERKAVDEWLFNGPGTYKPRVEVQVVATVKAVNIGPNQALKIMAKRDFVDSNGTSRNTGEEWLVKNEGPYMPNVNEEIRETLDAHVLTNKVAIQLEALNTFTDHTGSLRRAGDQWIVTSVSSDTHITDVNERVVREVKITVLNSRQYCVVANPVDKYGKNQFGKRELRRGEASFFLQPGETLEKGIQNVYVLNPEEALLLRASEAFTDKDENGKVVNRKAGDRWMIFGPTDYVPNVNVEVLETRRSISLDDNEGIYVRDITDGSVKAITGPRLYRLEPNEQLWAKELPPAIEELLSKDAILQKEAYHHSADSSFGGIRSSTGRDKTRVVTFRTPHNSAVQIFNYTEKDSRVVFGPDLVMLSPDEQFTMLSLSGAVPKRPNVIRALTLLMGPDFMKDVVVVETSDHARLSLMLSYNWFFDIDRDDKAQAAKIFSVPDFVGDACKSLASKVRAAVASQTFDYFHKHSAAIIREAVFGVGEDGLPKTELTFETNRLCITNIDIQSVEPVDSKTRDALQKSVQLAIEITTKSQEASAAHDAARLEQQARGILESKKIKDESMAEGLRKELFSLKALSAAVESTGQATAEASAQAEASSIEGKAAVTQAELSAKAEKIKAEARLNRKKAQQEEEIEHQTKLNELEIAKTSTLAQIESQKFKAIVESIGTSTLEAMAISGSELEVSLLESLKLQSSLVMDGNNPINLFRTAQGIVAKND